ncbi:hypothetical protein LOY38_09195 [Pseudomonas sp. B21-015]|uniref:hypothetical protein n=1 Tax=Pseudomonas sp. B21-015 TaxID=2895473 RepID=UPI00215F8AEA|nr:hypothetical protein [Pseudomonas sp. B21-015]UVM52191.1 hypothetical protein LOY38_09195 [Pseudomonas sp. B21-015]
MSNADLQTRWEKMLFGVRRSSRYHQCRRGFFDRIDRLSNIASLVFGSAAFYGVLQGPDTKVLALWTSAGVAFLGVVNLVWGCAIRARDHSDFMRRYVALEQRMLQPASEDLLLSITADRLSIEADEPPALRVLDCICHNEQVRADAGPPDEYVTIGFFQRLFSPFFDFFAHSLKKVGDKPKP